MQIRSPAQLLVIFLVAFSLVVLAGPMSNTPGLPSVRLAHANPQPCQTTGASGACSEYWYPAGPAMNTELATIFTDETAEYINIQSASPSIDLTDWPLTQSLVTSLTPNPNFLVTAPVSAHAYFEIQFMLANNFWGVSFNYGNDTNGIQIRQGIAHLTDKVKFVTSDPNIGGAGIAIDNPVPPSNGGLPAANPCGWDNSFPQSGPGCVVGAAGGTAYHLATAAGVNYAWQPALGSSDFCAAAQHFVNAGVASGMNPSTCVLTGISSAAASHPVNFFVRSDDPARLDLGNALAQEICALFGQGFLTNCSPYLQTVAGPITGFPGFTTSNKSVNFSWGMYTAGFLGVYPFDSSLYFGYNSRFVSGIPSIQPPGGICSSQSVPSVSASNYMYLCDARYDNLTSQMEFAPCITAPGDPVSGSLNNGPGGQCTNTSQLSAISAGVQAENRFGQGVYTIPMFSTTQQYAYLQNWSRIVNNDGLGAPNYFTWLNAYSATPTQAGTIRQGFKQTTKSLNPYIASTAWDFYMIGNIYDSLEVPNPLSNGQLIDWMALSTLPVRNSDLGYNPPPGTSLSFRFTLRSDLFWQDGRQVTPWDAKFTIMTLQATGAFQGSVLSPVVGVTVDGLHQFDINLNAAGQFTLLSLTSVTILPGRYWSTCAGGLWDGYVSTGQVPNSCMQADPNKITATYDPLANGILIGSGPWMCRSGSGIVGAGCSSTGFMNPSAGSSYTLTRFGSGLPPASAPSTTYFRSSGNLALWIWSQDTGNQPTDLQNFAAVAFCYQKALNFGSCAHFQQGIGAGLGQPARMVDLTQISSVNRFFGNSWVAPFSWANVPPLGIAVLANIVLYEGSVTLSPASLVGCPAGYDC